MEVNSESVLELSSLTGMNAEQAQFFLEAAGGDFQQALDMCNEQEMDTQLRDHDNNRSDGELVNHNMAHVAQSPMPLPPPPPALLPSPPLPPTQNQQKHGWLRKILRLPITIVSGTFGIFGQALTIGLHIFFTIFGRWMVPYSLLRRLMGLHNFNQQESDAQIQQRRNTPSLLSPQQESELFYSEFERNYGSVSPHFQISSWAQATTFAHQQGKITLVILIKSSQQDRKFCQQTLCRQEVVTFINDNFVCWGGQVDGESSGDVNSLMQRIGSMGVNGFRNHRGSSLQMETPMCMLLGFSGASLQVISSQHGCVAPDTFLEWLMHAQEVFQPRLEMEHRQQQELEVSRLLREEQDAAYVESLKIDQMKQEEKERKLQQQQDEEKLRLLEIERAKQLEQQRQQEAQLLEERKQQRKEVRKSQLPQEPATGEPSAALRVKLPDGSTSNRRFHQHDKVCAVFEYVESLDNLKCWSFNLVTQYPQKEYSIDEHGDTSLLEAGLCPSAVLYVKPQDD